MFAMIALRPDQSLGVTDLKGIDNFLMFCVNTLPVHRIPEIDRPINIQSIPQFSDQSTEPVHAREFNDREMKSAVVSAEFLEHQRSVGNDLIPPMPQYGFPGLVPGDRWGVCAGRWWQSYEAGVKAPVVLAATNQAALDPIPLDALVDCAAKFHPIFQG